MVSSSERDVDAAHREQLQLEFHVLPDLQDARVLEQRLQRGEHLSSDIWSGASPPPNRPSPSPALRCASGT